MRMLALLLTGGLAAAVAACSSDSSNGGTGGTGGGASGSGGAAGASGGAAGASGGAAGASGGAAGASGGAAGASGAGGAAGGGGSANAGCGELCSAIVAAGCQNGPTQDGCLLTCKTLTSSPNCDALGLTYMSCVKSAGVTCNAAGDPVATGCGLDYLKAIDCAVTENPNPDIVGPCSTYCGKVVAASCANNGTEAECNSNCKWLGAKGTGCDDEWGTFLTCANAANFICVLGYAAAQGCGQDFTAYTKCIDAAGNP